MSNPNQGMVLQTEFQLPQADFMEIPESDLQRLKRAAVQLENPGVAARIANVVGIPVEKAMKTLPEAWSSIISRTTKAALEKAMDSALFTLKDRRQTDPSDKTHKFLAGLSGAVGGTFGVTALAVELPVSATLMLRSIADIARSEGENISDINTKLACLEVFALGGNASSDDAADSGYYAVRAVLAKAIGDSTKHIASKGLAKESAPLLVRFLSAVSSRFSIPVSQKLAVQAVPAIGAIGGASINLIFMDHFQDMAKAHFTVRKLERLYGEEIIKKLYGQIADERARTEKDTAGFVARLPS